VIDTSARLGSRDDRVGRLERIIEPAVAALGFEVVRIMLAGNRHPTLQVMIEPSDRRPMDVEDCAEASRAISAVLDVEDPIAGGYVLEVSSPGIDRPLTRFGDFSRFAGAEARVESRLPISGRRRFRGRLAGVREEDVVMEVDGSEVAIPFADIEKAKLILTDELLRAAGSGEGPA
jgi:ribosome maturation factor RimP